MMDDNFTHYLKELLKDVELLAARTAELKGQLASAPNEARDHALTFAAHAAAVARDAAIICASLERKPHGVVSGSFASAN